MGDGVLVSGFWVRGPLADHAVEFAAFLSGQGYTMESARLQVHLVAQLSRWLTAEGPDVAGLTELEAERFVAARRARVRRLFRSRRALDPLITYLTLSEVLAASVAAPAGPVTEMVERYRRYLPVERGLTPGTAHVYVEAVRPPVASFATDARVELERITAADVSMFVLAGEPSAGNVDPVSRDRVAIAVAVLARGGTGRRVAGRRGAGCRRVATRWASSALEHGALGRLLDACDPNTAIGRRDRAHDGAAHGPSWPAHGRGRRSGVRGHRLARRGVADLRQGPP